MARRRQLYEGKAKILFEGPEPGTLVQYFKDDATAGNGAKKGIITGKGVLNNRISEYLMVRLQEIGMPTHFVRRLNMREQLIREVEIIPLEVVVRNVAAGSLATRLGIVEGTRLPRSIIEYYYKNDALNDPIVSEEHITCFGWANTADLDDIVALTLRINDFLCGPVAGRRHHAGRFQARIRPAVGKRGDAHHPGRRDQPGQLPSLGQQDQREDGQGPFPPRSRQGRGGLSGGRSPPGHTAGGRNARPQGPGADAVKAIVTVMMKEGVLDPQGKAIAHALGTLGFAGVTDVRAGKVIELELAEADPGQGTCGRGGDGAQTAGEHRDREFPGGGGGITTR